MFGWLAKMLISGPVQGSSCSCCEGKKKELERMQQIIENDGVMPGEEEQQQFCSGSYQAECSHGKCREKYFGKEENGNCSGNEGGCSCHRY